MCAARSDCAIERRASVVSFVPRAVNDDYTKYRIHGALGKSGIKSERQRRAHERRRHRRTRVREPTSRERPHQARPITRDVSGNDTSGRHVTFLATQHCALLATSRGARNLERRPAGAVDYVCNRNEHSRARSIQLGFSENLAE